MEQPTKIMFGETTPAPNIKEIPLEKRQSGFREEVIPHQWLNWLLKSFSDWDMYLFNRIKGTEYQSPVNIYLKSTSSDNKPPLEILSCFSNIYIQEIYANIEIYFALKPYTTSDSSASCFVEFELPNLKHFLKDNALPFVSISKFIYKYDKSLGNLFFKINKTKLTPYFIKDGKEIFLDNISLANTSPQFELAISIRYRFTDIV